jgi:hypothetical protein
VGLRNAKPDYRHRKLEFGPRRVLESGCRAKIRIMYIMLTSSYSEARCTSALPIHADLDV